MRACVCEIKSRGSCIQATIAAQTPIHKNTVLSVSTRSPRVAQRGNGSYNIYIYAFTTHIYKTSTHFLRQLAGRRARACVCDALVHFRLSTEASEFLDWTTTTTRECAPLMEHTLRDMLQSQTRTIFRWWPSQRECVFVAYSEQTVNVLRRPVIRKIYTYGQYITMNN